MSDAFAHFLKMQPGPSIGDDTSKTDETLRNVFAKKKTSVAADDSNKSKEEQAIELLKGLSPEQIMAVIKKENRKSN